MSKGTRTPNRYRTLWISDVHLGSEGCKAKALCTFLKQHDCDRLYLVGDIFDGWKLRSRFYWTPEHSRVIKAVISKARHGTKVYYLAGNHDDFMRQFVKKQLRLGAVRLANEVIHTTADGRRLLVMHGDTLDLVMNDFRWLAFAGDVAYEALMHGNTLVNQVRGYFGLPYWSLSAYAKTHVKSAVQYLSGFDEKILHRCRRDRLNGVVCGHTHHSEIRYIGHGVTSYNCGDWVESCTALAEDFDGDIQLLQVPAQPRTVTARARAPERVPVPRWGTLLPAAAERLGVPAKVVRRVKEQVPIVRGGRVKGERWRARPRKAPRAAAAAAPMPPPPPETLGAAPELLAE